MGIVLLIPASIYYFPKGAGLIGHFIASAADRTVEAGEKRLGTFRRGKEGRQGDRELHCIVAGFAPTPVANFADRCRPLQTVADHCRPVQTVADRCIVANFACNGCNDAMKRFHENECFVTLPSPQHGWQSTFVA
jgi:hypothetical protein